MHCGSPVPIGTAYCDTTCARAFRAARRSEAPAASPPIGFHRTHSTEQRPRRRPRQKASKDFLSAILTRIETAPDAQAFAAIEDDLARQRTLLSHKILGAIAGKRAKLGG